jgi:hypothetical protein
MLEPYGETSFQFVHNHPDLPEHTFEDIVELRPIQNQSWNYASKIKDMLNVVWDLEYEWVDDLTFFCEMEGGHRVKHLVRMWAKAMMWFTYLIRWKLLPSIFRTMCKY